MILGRVFGLAYDGLSVIYQIYNAARGRGMYTEGRNGKWELRDRNVSSKM